ncbi:hypothetical protein [Streptomyces sp. NPDC046371]|uniref:hypothetical protein n=1 Tax=Streptomyces sp. NPDC046371 TaxID=3154916 RepID=UPI0033D6DD7C
MDQGVAAVVAAAVAGTVAVAGSFIGVWVGRRTVRDQAQVEHDQWLRGKRQEAYLALTDAWDDAIPKWEARVLDPDDPDDPRINRLNREDAWDEAGMQAAQRMEADRAPVRRAVEGVQLLGPDPVERAAAAMLDTLEELSVGIAAQYVAPEEGHEPLEHYWQARGEVERRREAFLAAARDAVRRTPDTRRL